MLKLNKKIFLSHLLKNIDEYDEGLDLYLPKNYTWIKDETCFLLENENNENEFMDLPQNTSYEYIMGLYNVKDIIKNAKQQKYDVNTDELREALKFFYYHDAFINFKKKV